MNTKEITKRLFAVEKNKTQIARDLDFNISMYHKWKNEGKQISGKLKTKILQHPKYSGVFSPEEAITMIDGELAGHQDMVNYYLGNADRVGKKIQELTILRNKFEK